MKKEKSVLRVSISPLLVLILTIVIAISGCIENTNINNSAHSNSQHSNSHLNITDDSDNTSLGNSSDNTTDNTTDYKTDRSSDNTTDNATDHKTDRKNNVNITIKKSTDNATTGEDEYNVIVVITLSNVSLLKISLLKISVKNIETDNKIYGWKELNKSINQTDNQSTHSGNLPAGKYVQIRIMFNESVFEIPIDFSLNKTDKIYMNLDMSTETNKANNTTNSTIVINATVYKNLNLTMSKIFRFEIRTNSGRNKTEISDCKAKCETMCNNSAEEKCNVNNADINEKCASGCEQNLYSADSTQKCQKEINERCKIKCESGDIDTENQTQCNFQCKMNSLQPCMEKYVADERNICISQCRANASSQCSNPNFECYNKCLNECKE